MHTPSFIIYFLVAGVPLTYLAAHFATGADGNIRKPALALVVVVSAAFAGWMSWGATPLSDECRPAGPAIYSDC